MLESIRQFKDRLKFVKKQDMLSIFPLIGGYVASVFYKIYHKNIWLICERKEEARDNGYWFYKYIVEKHPEIEAVYAIDKSSVDYKKVASLGKVIQFSSLSHWMHYFAAKKNISSQKEGKPNAALCFILEVYLGARKNRVYLKHGIIKDAQRWIYYDISKLNLLCCAAQREYNFIKENFGYPKKNLALTGLCRFDNLLSVHETKRQILVMPTMREWLRVISSDTLKYEKTLNFCESEYFLTWSSLLSNQRLSEILAIHDLKLVFYPHPSMQQYVKEFDITSSNIIVADAANYDMQQLLMESAMLITDYSSIYFDFAYMEKPLVYYQFDYEKYRAGQYQQGYYRYDVDGFGPVVKDEETLINIITELADNGFVMPDMYRKRTEKFYAFRDCNNCERVYNAIMQMCPRDTEL